MSKVTGKRLAKPETLVIEESLRRFSDVAYQICTAGQIVAGGNCCTPFQVSSVTKTIGALLVLVIVEHGYISLSTKLCEYIPEWSTKPAYCDITISHLLKQSTGIARHMLSPFQQIDFNLNDIISLPTRFPELPMFNRECPYFDEHPDFIPGKLPTYYVPETYLLLSYVLELSLKNSKYAQDNRYYHSSALVKFFFKEILEPKNIHPDWLTIHHSLGKNVSLLILAGLSAWTADQLMKLAQIMLKDCYYDKLLQPAICPSPTHGVRYGLSVWYDGPYFTDEIGFNEGEPAVLMGVGLGGYHRIFLCKNCDLAIVCIGGTSTSEAEQSQLDHIVLTQVKKCNNV